MIHFLFITLMLAWIAEVNDIVLPRGFYGTLVFYWLARMTFSSLKYFTSEAAKAHRAASSED